MCRFSTPAFKNENKYLAWAYVEAANYARRFCPEAHAYLERKKAKTNSIVATKALANKLCKACYFIMKNHEDLQVEKIFGVKKGCNGEPYLTLAQSLRK